MTCPPVAAGETRALGACCQVAADCADGVCWNGFCTRHCTSAAEACGKAVAPSPLPVGTAFSCAVNQLADGFELCLPGSLTLCASGRAAPTTAVMACGKGEACALGLDPQATVAEIVGAGVAAPGAPSSPFAGLCLTTLIAGDYAPVGSVCASDTPYSCENQGGLLGSGCLERRCTRACLRSQECPVGMVCGPTPLATIWGGAGGPGGPAGYQSFAGVGTCQGRFCGQVHGEAGAAAGQVSQQGANAACVGDEVCVPTAAVGATGDIQYLSCVPPLPNPQAYGASCTPAPGTGKHCADDRLCLTRDGVSFCSQLCRTDADCPSGDVCSDGARSPVLPNGSQAPLTMCVPRARVGGTPCHGEKDCPRGTACLPVGSHSAVLVCLPTTGAKNVGEACTTATECRSGECADRDGNLPSGNNRTYCAAFCGKNSDCATGQICLRRVTSNNGTVDDPRDDVVIGFCTTLAAPALGGACVSDDNCTGQTAVDEAGGDTCDLAAKTCFTRGAHIGDACARRADCPLGAYCHVLDPSFPGGVCLSLGCDPSATAGVDACPAGALCLRRSIDAPLFGCYETCQKGTGCRRADEGYFCIAPDGQAATSTICMVPGGA